MDAPTGLPLTLSKLAKAGVIFCLCNVMININIIIGSDKPHEPQKLTDRLSRLISPKQNIRDDDCASIDKRITRNTLLQFKQSTGVEGIARGFAANSPPDVEVSRYPHLPAVKRQDQ